MEEDALLALSLQQEEFQLAGILSTTAPAASPAGRGEEPTRTPLPAPPTKSDPTHIPTGASSQELLDPNPDARQLFQMFDSMYFFGKLRAVEVKWSTRMTLCAGLCEYHRGGYCVIKLSKPLLQFRSRKEMIETLIHEMIHAYLFLTRNNRDRDGHGPNFQEHMHRINRAGGYRISIYHTFIEEVEHFRTHWWQCQGKCRRIVKRVNNRAPAKHDRWWNGHVRRCGGIFKKIREPPPKPKKEPKKKKTLKRKREEGAVSNTKPISTFFPKLIKGREEKSKEKPAVEVEGEEQQEKWKLQDKKVKVKEKETSTTKTSVSPSLPHQLIHPPHPPSDEGIHPSATSTTPTAPPTREALRELMRKAAENRWKKAGEVSMRGDSDEDLLDVVTPVVMSSRGEEGESFPKRRRIGGSITTVTIEELLQESESLAADTSPSFHAPPPQRPLSLVLHWDGAESELEAPALELGAGTETAPLLLNWSEEDEDDEDEVASQRREKREMEEIKKMARIAEMKEMEGEDPVEKEEKEEKELAETPARIEEVKSSSRVDFIDLT